MNNPFRLHLEPDPLFTERKISDNEHRWAEDVKIGVVILQILGFIAAVVFGSVFLNAVVMAQAWNYWSGGPTLGLLLAFWFLERRRRYYEAIIRRYHSQ